MGRGRNSDWFSRTVATCRPSGQTQGEWHKQLKENGINKHGMTYGRWDEKGAWVRGDPKKDKPGGKFKKIAAAYQAEKREAESAAAAAAEGLDQPKVPAVKHRCSARLQGLAPT